MGKFNEMTRVQMPAMVHLTRLGYKYFGRISESDACTVYDSDTNILLEVFRNQFKKLNPESGEEAENALDTIRQELYNDDLGKSFYKRLTSTSPYRLVDFDNPENNEYHFTAELTCKNGYDMFRPDITLFVNGLPLVFIEVKKPNNNGGMVAESRRMNNERFPNKKFRRFINITQLMIFSNNMEYDAMGGVVPLQGAFYCTAARETSPFNCFREETPTNNPIAPFNAEYPYAEIDYTTEEQILKDYNCQVIHHNPEYKTNLDINTPTNRILTSMCSPQRLLFILKYGIAYVKMEKEEDGKIVSIDQKHIMRYQQMFGSLAIRRNISEGARAGVVWHTQGSGKTALSFYLTHILSDYFATENIVAKFYFIVDRLDLMEQASQEFEARGLKVTTANSRKELMDEFRKNQALTGTSGKSEITVVNIQRFAHDTHKIDLSDYATNLQRIFIMDEAHRGYKPGGCFLANLFDADRNSIKIALTGTPLLKKDCASAKVFSRYFHVYYYDRSVADGYTLKIIREDIETSWKDKLNDVYDTVQKNTDSKNDLDTLVEKKDLRKKDIIEHPNYVRALADYVREDLKDYREMQDDDSLGGMVICETSEQARQLYKIFDERWQNSKKKIDVEIGGLQMKVVKEELMDYRSHPLKAGLVLHDSSDRETLKQIIKDFKKNMTIDILIVYNMLLTGFDAPRLKRLYLGRRLKDHNLLQALTRVNRPYRNIRYGRVIDFADIKENFKETNEAYLREMTLFNNPEETIDGKATEVFTQVIEDPEEILRQMRDVRSALFEYTTDNAEIFSSEISSIDDKNKLLELKKTLETAKETANLVRTFGDEDLKEDFKKVELSRIPEMLKEVKHHITVINQKQAFMEEDTMKQTIHEAMMSIQFTFSKIGQEELSQVGGGKQLQDKWRKTIRTFTENIDQDDPEYITLREAFMLRFKQHGFVVDSMAKYNEENKALDDIIVQLQNLQRRNNTLAEKYKGDVKFVRVHKRIRERNNQKKKQGGKPMFTFNEDEIMSILKIIKEDIDKKVYNKNDILKKDAFFEQTVMSTIMNCFSHFPQIEENAEFEDCEYVKHNISKQYVNQYEATYSAH